MADKYILRVTAGPGYDDATHIEVPVNKVEPVHVNSDAADIELSIRILNHRGLPRDSPSTSSYFSTEPHATNQDQYGISFRFTPIAITSAGAVGEANGIKGGDLQFGNNFDHPIRDKLPSGFNTAMSIVRRWIDPGLDGDAYADEPYLYGPALSSFNCIHVGCGEFDESKGGLWFEEGGDEQGMEVRSAVGMPNDGKARMKWALKDDSKDKWMFEYGKTYGLDFYNPYLDFANLTLKLPGFDLSIVKHWDGQGNHGGASPDPSHQLRYVLRNKESGVVYLVIVFTVFLKEDVSEAGQLTEGADAPNAGLEPRNQTDHDEHDGHSTSKVLRKAKHKLGLTHGETHTSSDDVE